MSDIDAVEQHAVFAVTADDRRVLVESPSSWDAAQYAWRKLDDKRRAGLFPHVKHFVVRSLDDPQWKTAEPSLLHRRPVLAGQRGHKNAVVAAKRAWKAFAPSFIDRGRRVQYLRSRGYFDPKEVVRSEDQGRGGTYYWPNGHVVARDSDYLATVCKRRGMIVQGVDGRWYLADLDIDADK